MTPRQGREAHLDIGRHHICPLGDHGVRIPTDQGVGRLHRHSRTGIDARRLRHIRVEAQRRSGRAQTASSGVVPASGCRPMVAGRRVRAMRLAAHDGSTQLPSDARWMGPDGRAYRRTWDVQPLVHAIGLRLSWVFNGFGRKADAAQGPDERLVSWGIGIVSYFSHIGGAT